MNSNGAKQRQEKKPASWSVTKTNKVTWPEHVLKTRCVTLHFLFLMHPIESKMSKQPNDYERYQKYILKIRILLIPYKEIKVK